MLKKGLYKLKIDEDFKRLIPPLSAEEGKQLENNIIQDGCRDALVIWGETIIDGHNRYEICTRCKIPFAINNISLSSREEAVTWICINQLGRRNISDETRRYLIGVRYEMEKKVNEQRNANGVNQHSEREVCTQNDHKPKFSEKATKTSERLGKEYKIAPATVRRFSEYANAIDAIAKAAPEFHRKIMSGELKITQDSIIRVSRFSPSKIRSIGAELIKNSNSCFAYTDERGEMRKNTPNKVQLELMNIGALKEMPGYDPDAEIQSLAFTIPSWVSSINRVREAAKFSEISDKAREKIRTALDELKMAIATICAAIEEDK